MAHPSAMQLLRNLLCLSALLFSSTVSAVGEVAWVQGRVSIARSDGTVRIPAAGERLGAGDLVATGGNGSVHLRMDDTGLIAVHPNTRLKIQAYSALGVATDQVTLRLFQGHIRVATGWIGRDNPERFTLQLPEDMARITGAGDYEFLAEGSAPDADSYVRVRAGGAVLDTGLTSAEVPAGVVVRAAGRLATPTPLAEMPAGFAGNAQDGARNDLFAAEMVQLDQSRDEQLSARRRENVRQGLDSTGKPRMGNLQDARQALTTLENILRAYEQGNLNAIRNHLDPSLIGYQKLLDDMAADHRQCKQMRIHLLDTQVQSSNELAIIQTRWEKRCLLMPDFKPVLITGGGAFLMHKGGSDWNMAQSGGNNTQPTCTVSNNTVSCVASGNPLTTSMERVRAIVDTPAAPPVLPPAGPVALTLTTALPVPLNFSSVYIVTDPNADTLQATTSSLAVANAVLSLMGSAQLNVGALSSTNVSSTPAATWPYAHFSPNTPISIVLQKAGGSFYKINLMMNNSAQLVTLSGVRCGSSAADCP